jgi:H+/Cl- antiporter ClcA
VVVVVVVVVVVLVVVVVVVVVVVISMVMHMASQLHRLHTCHAIWWFEIPSTHNLQLVTISTSISRIPPRASISTIDGLESQCLDTNMIYRWRVQCPRDG